MTPHDFTRLLPPLPDSRLEPKPPLMFRGVSARIFPLRANLDILQQLCDEYLNKVPPEAGFFRAPLPYVYLVVLDYGQIGEEEMRTGWFSQVEVYVGLPVEWYMRVQGQLVFYDWAVITPYIFVNDNVSVPVGRCVYGFPKVLATVEQTKSEWIKDPTSATTLARISTTVFPQTFAGGKLENKLFLEVERAALSNFRVPLDPTCPNLPWMIASNLAETVGGFGRDAMWLLQSMQICPNIARFAAPDLFPAMLSRFQSTLVPDGSGFGLNSINLKQFRHEEDTTRICYRALTNGRINTTAFNAAGLLGENHILLGDLSGAHSIRLYQHSTLPIRETLGLEVHQSWTTDGVRVDEFKPVLPFWINVDLTYNAGTNVALQHEDGIWRDGSGAPFSIGSVPNQDYNDTVATAIEAISGPFQFPGTTIRVIPLLADREIVQQFLDQYINSALEGPIFREDGTLEPHLVRLAVWGLGPQAIDEGKPVGGKLVHIYLTISSFGNVISESNNVGDWAKYELAFMIPVKWQRMSIETKPGDMKGEWETVGFGVVPAFTFADNCITAFTRLEIQGIPTGTAQFEAPANVWLGGPCAGGPQRLLRVSAELLPALGEGLMAKFEPIIEISTEESQEAFRLAPDTPWEWGKIQIQEMDRKKAARQQHFEELKIARALALLPLGNSTPISLYTLKQFPDVVDPSKACYQSLVRVRRALTVIDDLRGLNQTLDLRIYGYPSLNIVQKLGLRATQLDESAAGTVYLLQSVHPFCIHGTIDEKVPQRLLSRSGLAPWTIHREAFRTMFSSAINVDRKAETLQDQMDPSRTVDTMYLAQQRFAADEVPEWGRIDAAEAREALDCLDPQIVIESILSREWSNFDPRAQWRRGKQELLDGFGFLPLGGVVKPYAEAELYREINNKLAASPGAVAGRLSLEYLWREKDEFHWLDQAIFRAVHEAVVKGSFDKLLREIRDKGSWLWWWVFELKNMATQGARLYEVDRRWRQIITENLKGKGAAHRWRMEVKELIRNQQRFTRDKVKMEHCINMLAPLAILGMQGAETAYREADKDRPLDDRVPIPDDAVFVRTGQELLTLVFRISRRRVKGEPSTRNNLDPVANAQEERLQHMLAALINELKDEIRNTDSPEELLEKAMAHSTEAEEIVNLARAKCQLQFEALINKLSRAFQRPEFCIRRDSLSPADRDRLFPMALSWDEDWYYGKKIVLNPDLAKKRLKETVSHDEMRSNPANSPPAAGS